jgi:hypothetical protein
MVTRRGFAARLGMAAAATWLMPEMVLAQRATINLTDLPKDMVWLNANVVFNSGLSPNWMYASSTSSG